MSIELKEQNMAKIWSYYFYRSPQDFVEDMGLTAPDLGDIPGNKVLEILDGLRVGYISKENRKALCRGLGRRTSISNQKLFMTYFDEVGFEFRTIYTAVQERKRKLTRTEIRKYAAWSGLDASTDEDSVRRDIIKRWKKSFYVVIVKGLSRKGAEIGITSFYSLFSFDREYKKEFGGISISYWAEKNMIVSLEYGIVNVQVFREVHPEDDRCTYYSHTGEVLEGKWDVRCAPLEFEGPLLKEVGYRFNENTWNGDCCYLYETKDSAEAIKAIESLKGVQAIIHARFDAIVYALAEYRSCHRNVDYAFELIEEALKINPRNSAANVLYKKISRFWGGTNRGKRMEGYPDFEVTEERKLKKSVRLTDRAAKKLQTAIKHSEKAVKIDPSDEDVLELKAQMKDIFA